MSAGLKSATAVRRRRLSPETRREQLLACALSAFAAMGVERATHAEVARLAEVSIPTAFVYFPTREDLVEAVTSEVERFILTMIEAAFDPATSPGERLLAVAHAFGRAVDEQPDHIRVWLDWSTTARADTWRKYREVDARLIGLVAEVMREARGAEVRTLTDSSRARLFVGGAYSLAIMKFDGLPAEEVEDFISSTVAAILLAARHDAASADARRP